MNQKYISEGLISKRNSLILKGEGILLMLIHHLFYSPASRDLYDDIIVHGVGLVNQIGVFSKLCVSIFVFVSGYGLAVSTPENMKLKSFYWHRFKKLYLNYWFIWILFVPVSVFVFGRTFTEAYGDHVEVKAVLDFFGLLKMFDVDSYNPTWWFYNCIIVLYLLFPFLNKWIWKTPYFIISMAVTVGLFFFIPGLNVIFNFLLVFITGMLMTSISPKWLENTRWWHILIALVMLATWRFTKSCPKHIADSLLCVGMALLLYKVPLWAWIQQMFEELGRHSMNIFLTHTFLYHFWFREYIYITRNPLVILLSLLLSTYLLSVMIEWTKQRTGFYNLLRK